MKKTQENSLNLLVLDDEKRVREEIEEFLVGRGFTVYKASKPSEAFQTLKNEKIDLAILDIKLPEMDGLEVLKIVKKEYPDIEIIMISGHGDISSVIEAMRLGAADFFQKPFRLLEIGSAIERTTRFINLQNKLKEVEKNYSLLSKELYKDTGHQLIGNSKAIKNVIEMMSLVAKADDTSVLITGESGTGKELVARGIHYLSNRNKNYFHSVNCSAIPESLFESEFFGHKKGSFTGATENKAGWFEIANKGTLFLDEVSNMPISQQAKLLRVLEDKKVNRVGTHTNIEVNVRVIAASNQKLEELAESNDFRIDLYHRLSSFIIHIPPLRERKDDIPLLFDHFIKEIGTKMGKPEVKVDHKIYEVLHNYHFPGNIRELRNMAERALIISGGKNISLEKFMMIIPDKAGKNISIPLQETNASVDFDLEKAEKNLIIRALEKTDFNKSKTAELLKITWQSLDRRMKKFGLSNKS